MPSLSIYVQKLTIVINLHPSFNTLLNLGNNLLKFQNLYGCRPSVSVIQKNKGHMICKD